jgi:hypothetical protein
MNRAVPSSVAVLIAVALAWGGARIDESTAASELPSRYDARLIELDRVAVEEAYRETIKRLFGALVRTSITHPSEPVMSGRGARLARKSYTDAMMAIDEREQKLRR